MELKDSVRVMTKEERRMMFVCGDDIASLIKRFENESK